MTLKTLPQRKFLKGCIATQPKWEQSPGSIPRISNLLLGDRGGLRNCDGSLIISELNGALAPGTGPWTDIFLFSPANVNRYYIGIKKDYTSHILPPVIVSVVDAGAGGTLLAGTYGYGITSLDGAGGETTGSGPSNITILANHKVTFTWTPAVNAAGGYNIYRTQPNGATSFFLTTISGQSSSTFTDDGSIALNLSIGFPATNSTQQMVFYKIPATSYGAGNVLANFPADPFVPQDGTPGGQGPGQGAGGGTTNPASGAPPSPTGGNIGNTSPIPQIVQFANKAVLALGNGFAPQLFTDPSTVAAITNTFTASYPNWIASTVFAQGSKIMPTAGNAGNFIFTAQQGGTTGGGAPTWPQTPNQIVNDNNIIWQNTGAASTAPAPRGAAHAEVYAGSLWLANTSPTTTADNFDGPTCIKMSDLNNPTSWNPLNTAFLGKDDGDQITGLKAFTIAADGITPTGSLLAFKYFKTFQIVGVFGAADFAVQEAKTDMGCIAPRSIQFLPGFGIVRLTHLGVAIFDGTNDRLISEEIRPYIFQSLEIGPDIAPIDQNFAYLAKGAQSANPPMYMLAIPLLLTGIPSSGNGGISFTLVAGAPTFVTNTFYYFRATKFTIQGNQLVESALTQEVKFVLNTQVLQVASTGTPDPLAVKYRVYMGTASGGYTNYQEFTTLPQTFTGPASFTQAGSVNNGIGGMTRILCYDLVLKAWTIIDLPFSISVLKQVRPVGSTPITITGGFNDGSMRRLQGGDTTFDGTPISWSMRSAEVFGKLANSRIYYRRLTVRGTTTQTNLAMNAVVSLDGADGVVSPMTVYQLGNTLGTFDFLAQIDIGFTNYTSHVTLSGSGDVEITSLDWEAATLREGVPPII